MKEQRDTPRPTMSDEEMVKDYPRLSREYTLLHQDYREAIRKPLTIPVVSFELPSDEVFDMPEVDLKNPLEEFYYYERPPYLKSEQKDFKERLQKALNYLKGN
jgi:hypothetical protein